MKWRRFQELKSLEDEDDIEKVELDEEWIPPHKMAAFTPYDAIVTLDYDDEEESELSKEEFEELLDDEELSYDEILSFESEESPKEVFISLVSYSNKSS